MDGCDCGCGCGIKGNLRKETKEVLDFVFRLLNGTIKGQKISVWTLMECFREQNEELEGEKTSSEEQDEWLLLWFVFVRKMIIE